MRRHYHLFVLWLLSVVAPGAAEAIYRHGYDDGTNELREFMRRELTAVQAACVADRLRAYNNGVKDTMRHYGDEPDESPAERVM